MMGMSSTEWSRYLHEVVGLTQAPDEINAEVVRRMIERYEQTLPLVAGATDAVRRLHADGARLAVASSSNPPLIAFVLEHAGIRSLFEVVVSSEEVARGKPAPDVYLEAASRLGVAPSACVAVEDSDSGIRAARAAGMAVVAFPNRRYPPSDEALAQAVFVVDDLARLDTALLGRAAAGG
jgi:HAD superfamily hydrolase (TIGR01509 family)